MYNENTCASYALILFSNICFQRLVAYSRLISDGCKKGFMSVACAAWSLESLECFKWLSEAQLNTYYFWGRLPIVYLCGKYFLSARNKTLGEELAKYTDS